jgi:hypothetical protein
MLVSVWLLDRIAVVKLLSGPAVGRPQGPGLDNGVPEMTPATLEEEPRQGLLCASPRSLGLFQCLRRLSK